MNAKLMTCFVLEVFAAALAWIGIIVGNRRILTVGWAEVILVIAAAFFVIAAVVGWKQWQSWGQFFVWLFPTLLLLLPPLLFMLCPYCIEVSPPSIEVPPIAQPKNALNKS